MNLYIYEYTSRFYFFISRTCTITCPWRLWKKKRKKGKKGEKRKEKNLFIEKLFERWVTWELDFIFGCISTHKADCARGKRLADERVAGNVCRIFARHWNFNTFVNPTLSLRKSRHALRVRSTDERSAENGLVEKKKEREKKKKKMKRFDPSLPSIKLLEFEYLQ